MKRVPLRDATDGQTYLLEGETNEYLPNDNTVYIDRAGKTYDPAHGKVALNDLADDGVMQLPRTTWFGLQSWIVKRTIAYTLIVTVTYNLLVAITSQAHAPALRTALALVQHLHGFTLGIAAGCLATGETALLAITVVAILLATSPTDLIALTIPLVLGGLLGTLLRNLVRAHHESLPTRPDRH
jgi:hypothetical protein